MISQVWFSKVVFIPLHQHKWYKVLERQRGVGGAWRVSHNNDITSTGSRGGRGTNGVMAYSNHCYRHYMEPNAQIQNAVAKSEGKIKRTSNFSVTETPLVSNYPHPPPDILSPDPQKLPPHPPHPYFHPTSNSQPFLDPLHWSWGSRVKGYQHPL